MVRPVDVPTVTTLASGLTAVATLVFSAGCAGTANALEGRDCRWLLTTVGEHGDLDALRQDIGRRAGVPVLALRPIGERVVVVALGSADAAACQAAADRVAADQSFAAGLQPDSRRALPVRPAASAAR
jgi:hypothetical protein